MEDEMVTTTVGLPDAPTSVAERDKYVVAELKRLRGIADRQDMFINELVSRLSPVTLAEHTDENTIKDYPSNGVPLADDMAAVARDLERTNETFEDLLSRLEI